MNKKTNAGFSLLELLIVLAIMGAILVPLTRFIMHRIEDNNRQQLADAITNEIYHFIEFAKADELELIDGNFIRNPLYQQENVDKTYGLRQSNYKIEDNLLASNKQLNWRRIREGQDNSRLFFINSACKDSKSNLNLKKEYLYCDLDPLIKSGTSDLTIDRIDLIGDEKTKSIDRIDFFIRYHPNIEKEKLYFDNYYNNFITSFNNRNIFLTEANVIRIKKNEINNTTWQLVKREKENIKYGDIISNMDLIPKNDQYNYGIRFSFDVKTGQFLKADGSVNTDKLCWNTKNNKYGPCLTAKDENKLILTSGEPDLTKAAPELCWNKNSNNTMACLAIKSSQTEEDPRLHLIQHNKDGSQETGTLISNIILEDEYYDKSKNKYFKEYRTPIKTVYLDFKGQGEKIKIEPSYVVNINSEENNINFAQQTCPLSPIENKKLYPRLAVSISSFVATQDDEAKFNDINLSQQALTRESTRLNNQGVMGSIILQINEKDNNWIVSATTSASNLKGFQNYISPKTLSIVAFMWCSSIKQDDK